MRVLITTTGGAGHFGPLVPFAEALRADGAELLVACRVSRARAIEDDGYAVWAFADPPPEHRAPVFERALALPHEEANALVVSEAFARIDAAAALPRVLEACEHWEPDLVLSEIAEFAGPIAAEACGIPAARAGIGLPSLERRMLPHAFAAIDDVRALAGLPPDRGGERVAALPYVTLMPPSLDDVPLDVLRFREHDRPAAPLPDWWGGSDAPLVYATFGSVVPTMPFWPGIYRAAVAALATVPARVLLTIGRDQDPAELGPLPANVHVERWVPQAAVMPHAAAMVCHGGSGTVRAGLSAGVPMAVLPLFADQPGNARRVAELGAGVAVAGPEALRDAVGALLSDPGFESAAAAVAADVRRLPTVDAAVGVLRAAAAVAA